MSLPESTPWFALSLLVVVADQISKHWVLSAFAVGEVLPLSDFFNLVLVFNSGAAFSFLAGAGGWQKWFFIVLALLVSVWLVVMIRNSAGQGATAAAMALVLGGAIGNVIDRLRFGAVADFLDFHLYGWHWPAFNVADAAITGGVALLLWRQLFVPEPGEK